MNSNGRNLLPPGLNSPGFFEGFIMKKGDEYTGIVNRIDFPNKGIVEVEGCEVVVKNVLPGQEVRFRISKKRNGRVEGRLLEVIKRADYEREADCPHYPECGGCLYRTISYEKELRIKEDQVRRLLKPLGTGLLAHFQGVKPSPDTYGYRNKMEFSFGDEYKDGPLSLGLHKRGGFYDIVNVSECRIVDEDYRTILKASQEFFRKTGLSFYRKMQHKGYLRHLVVRKAASTGEILVNIVTTTQEDYDMGDYASMLLSLPLKGALAGILHTLNDSLSDVVTSDETKVLYGRDYFYEELLGLRFKISPFSFFQTNSKGAEVLYSTAREYIIKKRRQGTVLCLQNETLENTDIATGDREPSPVSSAGTIFDLYSGTGTIGQILSPAAGTVIGVEIVEEAVKAANENTKLNGIDNCRFLAGDVLKVIDDIDEKPDFIVLDPPRDGIHPKALPKILEKYKCKNILYISCKITSLIRDLEVLEEYGYLPESICCVDMFPGTPNIETLCKLTKMS